MKRTFLFIAIVFLVAGFATAALCDTYAEQRRQMIKWQIKGRGVTDERVLRAMMKVQRHLFVPRKFREEAYRDTPLPIGYGQTISQPYIVAYMTEAARLEPNDRVLEIGTGSGYQAAVLSEIVREVYTVEILKPLAESAAKRLKQLGYKNVNAKRGDGYKGWPEHAPFDAIIVTAAPPEIPEELIKQLKTGGKMVVPVGSFFQEIYLITRTKSGFEKKALMPVRFVPMIKGKKK